MERFAGPYLVRNNHKDVQSVVRMVDPLGFINVPPSFDYSHLGVRVRHPGDNGIRSVQTVEQAHDSGGVDAKVFFSFTLDHQSCLISRDVGVAAQVALFNGGDEGCLFGGLFGLCLGLGL